MAMLLSQLAVRKLVNIISQLYTAFLFIAHTERDNLQLSTGTSHILSRPNVHNHVNAAQPTTSMYTIFFAYCL